MTEPMSSIYDNPRMEELREVIEIGARLAAETPDVIRQQIAREFAEASEKSRRIERGEIPPLAG